MPTIRLRVGAMMTVASGSRGWRRRERAYVVPMSAVVIQCERCGQSNRVPYSKVDMRAACGKCKTPLAPVGKPVEVERAAELRKIVAQSSLPVVVDFWAAWCGPCRMVAPEIVKIAAARAGEWLVVKANTEVDPQLGAEHRVQSIPLMAVFSRGREVARTAGARPAAAIESFVRESLAGSGTAPDCEPGDSTPLRGSRRDRQ